MQGPGNLNLAQRPLGALSPEPWAPDARSHCPEFTLTYPSYNPAGTWQEAMSRVDQEVRRPQP